jgi:hypothetical protein
MLLPVDDRRWKESALRWCAPPVWCAYQGDREKLGSPGALPAPIVEEARKALAELEGITGLPIREVSHRSRRRTWRRAHIQLYGVDALPPALHSRNGHSYHYGRLTGVRRECVLWRRKIAGWPEDARAYIVRHELGHAFSLCHPEEVRATAYRSVMVPMSLLRGGACPPWPLTSLPDDVETLRHLHAAPP